MPGGRNCCPGKGTEAMVGGTVPEGLRAGREVRCPDRMPGTRLGPENPNEESHETDRAGAGAEHDATPGNQGGGGGGALVRGDKAQADLAKGPSEKRQGRAATGPVQDSGSGRMCGRRCQSSASIWASVIENREQRRATGSQAGAWPREGGDKTGQTGLSGQASAHGAARGAGKAAMHLSASRRRQGASPVPRTRAAMAPEPKAAL